MAEEIKNIVVIVSDALRPDRVGAYSGDDLTPNIDALAENGEVFGQCFCCINATDPSVTTILTGQYPTRHGIINHGSSISEKEQNQVSGTIPLPERIANTHYTVGIDSLERWHQQGFDTYINPNRSSRNKYIELVKKSQEKMQSLLGLGGKNRPIRSETITDLAIKSLQNNDQPFFLFAHYWETHIPYVPIAEHPDIISNRSYEGEDIPLENLFDSIDGSPWGERLENRLTGDATTVADMKRKYDAGVWSVDQSIGRLVDELKNEGVYDETAIIVTADHGESFTEHGIFFDHHGLYDPTIHVPLIINAPGFEGRESRYVQHFDLVPTILDLLNVDYNENEFDGRTLYPEDGIRAFNRDAVYIEESHTARKRAIRTEAYKYIQRIDNQQKCEYCGLAHAPEEELFNIKEDSDEKQNIVKEERELAQQLKQKQDSWIQDLPEPSSENEVFEPSEEVKNHLEDMGYR